LWADEHSGLAPTEASTRLETYGPNAFVAAKTEPRRHAFVRQYRDPMQIVLLVAGIGSIWPLKELGTGLVLLFLTLFNAVLGVNQEGKAAAAVAALQKMMIVKAKVRRDGRLIEVPAEQLVPGDIVAIEAGDVVPADGRLLRAATLEVAESALTGESMPVAKSAETVTQTDARSATGPTWSERDHEAPALDRDARLDLGHQLRQGRHADAQSDDSGGADDPRPPLHDRRHSCSGAGRRTHLSRLPARRSPRPATN
jgi:magnesium-transporting ATPase (P-type)